jgi:hypothetical protein
MFQFVIVNDEINPMTPNTHTFGEIPWKKTVIDERKIAIARIRPRPNFFESVGVKIPPKTAPEPAPAMRTPKYLAWTPRVSVMKRISVDVERE